MATIFSDGFESGDFSAWTGIFGSPSVQNTIKHCGTYAMSVTGVTQYAFKTLDSTYTRVFSRVYWQASDAPAAGEYTYLSECRAADWDTVLAACGVWNDGGTINWILYINGNSYYYTLGSCAADTWYCVETEYNSVSDTHKLWLNGVNVIEQSDSETGEVKYFKVGTPGVGFWGSAFYWDCVAVSDSYIGPETSGPESLSVELSSPTNATSVTSYSQIFTYTPTIIGSDSIQNASLYIDNSLVASNTTAITNATANSIAYNFTSNGTYDWTIGVWNTTHQVFPSSNYTLTVNVSTTESSASNDEAIAIAFLAVACAVAFPVVFLTAKKRNET